MQSPQTKFVSCIAAVLLGMGLGVSARAGEAPGASPVVQAARDQIGKTLHYDPAYRSISYPMGDVPLDTGVCADVVVRALRKAGSLDLQKLVHEDMAAHFSAYPQRWGLRAPDKNIDHRRVPNLQTWFKRNGWEVPVSKRAGDYRPGDIVTCTVPPHLPHVMIVSDKNGTSGRPLVIHNIGQGTQEEDRLFDFVLTGHYRMPKPTRSPKAADSSSRHTSTKR